MGVLRVDVYWRGNGFCPIRKTRHQDVGLGEGRNLMEARIAKVTACYLAHQWNGNGAVRWLATLSTLIVGRHDHESVSSRQIRPGVTTDPAHAPSCQGHDPAMIQVLRDQASPREGRCREALGFHRPGPAWGRLFLAPTPTRIQCVRKRGGSRRLSEAAGPLSARNLRLARRCRAQHGLELPALVFALIVDWLLRMVIDLGRQEAEVDVRLFPVTNWC